MTDDDRLSSLLMRWQEEHAQGRDVPAKELCRETPELAKELDKQIEVLRRMQALMPLPEALPSDTSRAAAEGNLASTSLQSVGLRQTLDFTPNGSRNDVGVAAEAIPGYELMGVLGRGGMGIVYKARHLKLGRVVAIKMILSGGHAGAAELERFRTEAESVARLQHPNIVQIFEVGEQQGMPFFSLEYCGGGSLKDQLAGTPLAPAKAAEIVETLAHGIQAAHERKIVHRDLKPANVLLTQEGAPKITDFGLAKKLDEAGQTHSGAIMGTPSYMAPEQALGKIKDIGAPADVYALGAILYECLTGRPPFKAETAVDTILQVTSADPVPPTQFNRKIPRDFETICLKCLRKEPGRRYASAAELADDLRRARAGEPIAARPIGPLERAAKWVGRNRGLSAGLAAAVLALLVGTGVSLWLAVVANIAAQNEFKQREFAEDARKAAVELAEKARESEKAERIARKEAEESARAEKAASEKERQAKAKAVQESQRATKVAGFLVGLFDAADPIGLTGYLFGPDPEKGTSLTAKAILDRGTKKIQTELQDDPEVRAALLTTIGEVRHNLGDLAPARDLLEEARAIREKHKLPLDAAAAKTLFSLAWVCQTMGDYDRAEEHYLAAIRAATAAGDRGVVNRAKINLGFLLTQDYRDAEAEKLFREVLAERLKTDGKESFETAVAQAGLAAVLLQRQRAFEAIPHIAQAMATVKKHYGEGNLSAAALLIQDALVAREAFADLKTARAKLDKALVLVQEMVGERSVYTITVYCLMAETSIHANDDAKAEEQYAAGFRNIRATVGLHHPMVQRVVTPYAIVLARRGKKNDGIALQEEFVKVVKEKRGPFHPSVFEALAEYGVSIAEPARRKELFAEAAAIAEKNPPERIRNGPLLANQFAIRAELEDPAAAERYYRLALRLAEGRDQYRRDRAVIQENLTKHLANRKRLERSEGTLVEGVRDPGSFLKLAGKIDSKAPAVIFQVRLSAGATYTIDLTSPNTKALDPYLIVQDEKNSVLASDDDSGGALNARIVFRPAADGVYRLRATSFNGGSGEFGLTVRKGK